MAWSVGPLIRSVRFLEYSLRGLFNPYNLFKVFVHILMKKCPFITVYLHRTIWYLDLVETLRRRTVLTENYHYFDEFVHLRWEFCCFKYAALRWLRFAEFIIVQLSYFTVNAFSHTCVLFVQSYGLFTFSFRCFEMVSSLYSVRNIPKNFQDFMIQMIDIFYFACFL